jgi:hypothetical protein
MDPVNSLNVTIKLMAGNSELLSGSKRFPRSGTLEALGRESRLATQWEIRRAATDWWMLTGERTAETKAGQFVFLCLHVRTPV